MKIIHKGPVVNPVVVKMVKELWDLHIRAGADMGYPKILTIKSVRKILGLSMREARDLVEVVCEDRNIHETVLVNS